MEGGKGLVLVEKKRANSKDAVIQIPDPEEYHVTKEISGSQSSSKNLELGSLNIEVAEIDINDQDLSSCRNQLPVFAGSASPDNKPADTPSGQSLTRRKSVFRFAESHDEQDDAEILVEGNTELMKLTPRTPLMASPEQEDEYEEVYKKVKINKKHKKGNKLKKLFLLIELIAFGCVMGLLIGSLIVSKLKNHFLWQLKLWKWCVLVLVIFCGRLVTKLLMIALICLIEKNFKLKLMVLYYLDGLRRSVRAFIWFALVLLAWCLLFERGVERSKETKKIVNYITRGLVACLVGAVLWMVKTFSFKLLVASRLSKRFFDQIQEAMFDEYVISTCSGSPLIEHSERVGSMSMKNGTENQEDKEEVIYHVSGKRKKMKKISAWTMEKLINHISSTKLSIVSNELDVCENDELDGDYNKNIESEWEAKAAAYQIFQNVAGPGSKYMDECDLLRFFIKEEVDEIMQRLGQAETGRVKRSDVTKWVVNVYKQRKSLAHYLNNSKEAMQELNRLFRGIVIVLIIIVWLLIVGLLTTKALLVILSQVVLAVFLFGNTAKNVFEAIIFLFVTHPFDVGDRCVIDGVQMVVEEMHILTTTFLRYDNEKIFYPNSVLASKPISNFYRSTVDMRDAVEFAIDVFTPLEKIGHLKSKIKNYLESKPRHWSPNHSVVVKQIKDEKMIMGLYVTHIIIFENYEEKINRRSELVLELTRIFEQVAIRIYHVVPQEVQVSYVGSATSSAAPPPES
ncbi:Mechanosensitive ion channel protein [Citrus sinensis]|uniref:mechanosensitive ion channel protein 10-like n=1 Tax=Citrus sinensis TaxID=2711 RepID=UPI0003D787A9|nr:mechanosensitive ion channel protein 10-like [Citrus sinensis]KAH9706635.1 Mechanosensitive ion channel protein [Citrus sinensis]GAY43155.1 hypothetical protein CUMW_072350 [Citrus unshiu]